MRTSVSFRRLGVVAATACASVALVAAPTLASDDTESSTTVADSSPDTTTVPDTTVVVETSAAPTSAAPGASTPATTPESTDAADPTEVLAGMRVIIGNDDGVQPGEGDGMFAIRTALCAAGADVVVVAPWSQQSGTSAAITFGAVFGLADAPDAPPAPGCDAAPSGGLVYGVCLAETACAADSPSATPSDAISLGINGVAAELGWEEGPDLVIIGINAGGNEGLNVPLSGTIGAASWAVAYGAPTLALSAKSETTPETLAADAEWTVALIAALVEADALPQDYLLSVNFPSPGKGPVAGVAWTTVAEVAWGGTLYERDGDVVRTSYGECPYATCGYAGADTDAAALEQALISVSPIVVDRSAGADIDTAAAQAVVESLTALPAR